MSTTKRKDVMIRIPIGINDQLEHHLKEMYGDEPRMRNVEIIKAIRVFIRLSWLAQGSGPLSDAARALLAEPDQGTDRTDTGTHP